MCFHPIQSGWCSFVRSQSELKERGVPVPHPHQPHQPHFHLPGPVLVPSRSLLCLFRHTLPGFQGCFQSNNGDKCKINSPFHPSTCVFLSIQSLQPKAAAVTAGIYLTVAFSPLRSHLSSLFYPEQRLLTRTRQPVLPLYKCVFFF